MALGLGRKAASVPEPAPRRRSLVASAIRTNFNDASYNSWKFRDETWQRELWRLYDLIPEFGFASRWVGQCCSRVRIYVAKVDDLGRVQEETKEPKINALADTLLGGPAAKAEALRSMGINLTVAGECYIVGRPNDDTGRDEWYVMSSSEIRKIRSRNGEWQWAWGTPDGMPFKLDLTQQVVTRVWTPHPQRIWCADSPSRSCQATLRELEQLTKYIFSQIDSRLVGAGLLVIPNNLDLPQEENTTNASESLMVRLATAGAASLRGEGSALAVLPHIVESDPATIEGWKLLSFESELSKQAMELRKEAVERLGVGMDMPPEVLSGMGESNHWCLSMDTQIYSRTRGWVNQDELSIGDLVLTLNHDTGISEWQPVQHIYRADVVDEPMLQMEGQNHSSLSTMEHRWPVIKGSKKISGSRRRWTTSQEGFAWLDRVPIAAACGGIPVDAKFTDDFVRLVAAYTSDGTILYRDGIDQRPAIRIAKFQQHEIDELRRVLESVYGYRVAREYAHPTRTADGIAFVLNVDEAEALFDVTDDYKAVTLQFVNALTQSQLELFLSSMIDVGDGVTSKNARIFFQVEPERLEALEHAAILAGYAVRRGIREKNKDSFSQRPLHWISISRSRMSFSPMDNNPEHTTYTGTVWCPTTANGTWFARRNGTSFFTGNSGFLIDGYGIKVHIEPLMNRICDALTKAYLVPALKLMGKDPARYTYSFDTSPLSLRPQRLQDALNLYEKNLLSGEAVRAAGYFKESDAPTEDENGRKYLQEVVLRDPQLIQNQAIREAVGIPEDLVPQSAMIAPTAQSISMGGGSTGLGSGGSGPPPPPPPPTGIGSELPPPMPDTLGNVGAPPPGGNPPAGGPPTGIQAGAANLRQLQQMGVVVLAEATVRRGLELAGKRLLDRHNRDRWPDVPSFELHTRIKVQDVAHANRLLNGAWDQIDAITKLVDEDFDTDALRKSLTKYCVTLLIRGIAHDPPNLLSSLQADGVVHG